MPQIGPEQIVDFLTHQGISPLPMPTGDLLGAALEGWLRMLANPPKGRCAWEHKKKTLPPDKPDYDLGFFQLAGEPDPADPTSLKDVKDVLHVRDYLPELLGRENPDFLAAHTPLIDVSLELLARALTAMEPVVLEIDRRFGTDLGRRLRVPNNDHVVRYLAYRGVRADSEDEQVIGQGHRDRAGSTITVLESMRAVQIVQPGSRAWKNIQSSRPDRPNVFNAAKMDVATGGKLAALPHRVVRYHERAADDTILEELGITLPDGIIRVSIIIFIHYDGIVIPTTYVLKYRSP